MIAAMEYTHRVVRGNTTYYMTDEEYDHADEWIKAIEDEIKLRTEAWEKKKEELHEKWEKELPFE